MKMNWNGVTDEQLESDTAWLSAHRRCSAAAARRCHPHQRVMQPWRSGVHLPCQRQAAEENCQCRCFYVRVPVRLCVDRRPSFHTFRRLPTRQSTFFNELSSVFEWLATFNCPMIICGDFNIHIDGDNDVHGAHLADVLQLFDYVQHVTGPTHKLGHTLDLVITRADTDVSDVRVGDMVSDHALVHFTLRSHKSTDKVQSITSRAWRKLSMDTFSSDLAASSLCADPDMFDDMSADEMAQLYRSVMTGLLDKHCPVVTIRRKTKHTTPWFDSDCRVQRRRDTVRAAERRFCGLVVKSTDRSGWRN